jgi:hypothetical protein
MIGLFSIFRGYADENATASETIRSSDEQNEVYVGFSRDGFHWWRQHDGDAQVGGHNPRRAFMSNSWPVHTWRRADVQSVGGGFTVVGDKLHFYSSGTSDLPYVINASSLKAVWLDVYIFEGGTRVLLVATHCALTSRLNEKLHAPSSDADISNPLFEPMQSQVQHSR